VINHYKTLGLSNAASAAEIRRAYRILARRYHPDVNPSADSENIFKKIASAYSVLSDPEQKQQYDLELKQSQESFEESFERATETLRKNQRANAYRKQAESNASTATEKNHDKNKENSNTNHSHRAARVTRTSAQSLIKNIFRINDYPINFISALKKRIKPPLLKLKKLTRKSINQSPSGTALIELSISMHEAIHGARKTVNLATHNQKPRKVSVGIPPGVRTGSLVKLRGKDSGNEIVLVINVESHPWITIGERGVTMEIAITVGEALEGAKIRVPSFGDPLLVTVEPRTQSGREVRLKNQGVFNRDGTRGDLFIKFIVKIPDKELPNEIRSVNDLFADSYSREVRAHLPKRILE
jgi:DnaJ-class molecular chaperone